MRGALVVALLVGLATCKPLPPGPTPLPTPSATPAPTPAPEPSPSPASCPSVVYKESLGLVAPTRIEEVNEAITFVKATHPEWFNHNGQLIDWPVHGNAKADAFFFAIQARLAERGVCSYFDGHGGDIQDEIQVRAANDSPFPRTEGYRIVNFGGGGVWDAANSYKFGSVRIEVGNAPPDPPSPTPTPVPSVSPTPAPTPTPVVGGCAAGAGDVDYFRNIVKPHGLNQQLDFTIVACGDALVQKINNGTCMTHCCELSQEKGQLACGQALFGEPQVSGSGSLVLVPIAGWTTFKVKSGIGVITICGLEAGKPGNCVTVNAYAEVPACKVQVGSNQGCVNR